MLGAGEHQRLIDVWRGQEPVHQTDLSSLDE